MPGEEGKKVSGNHKGKKGKGSRRAPNPLAAIRGQVLIPKASSGANTKGASHTLASVTKGASHTPASESKDASNTQLMFPKKSSKGASNTQVPGPSKDSKESSATREQRSKASKKGTSHTQDGEELKEAQPKEVVNLSDSAECAPAEEQMRAQAAKERVSEAMTHLARELCSLGGPLLSDVLDANHMACYLALEAEKNSLAPNMFTGDCVFTVMEM